MRYRKAERLKESVTGVTVAVKFLDHEGNSLYEVIHKSTKDLRDGDVLTYEVKGVTIHPNSAHSALLIVPITVLDN